MTEPVTGDYLDHVAAAYEASLLETRIAGPYTTQALNAVPILLEEVERLLGDSPVLAEVRAERARQDTKWGEQNHPDLDPRDIYTVTRNEYVFRATRWQEINAERAQHTITPGRCPKGTAAHTHTAWDGVLLEEVYEALAEDDQAKLRAELIQTAAVCVAWVEALDRRTPQVAL